MAKAEFYVTILNYEQLIENTESVIQAAICLNLPAWLVHLWVSQYLRENIQIRLEK